MKGEEKQKPQLGGVRAVEQQLYSNNSRMKEYKRYGFHDNQEKGGVNTSWDEKENNKEKQEGEEIKDKVDLIEKKKKKSRALTPFTKILIASILFFLFSVGAAVMVFVLNTNQVEFSAVRLSVLGPNSVAGGEELQFDISITNDNPVDVVLSDVIINYPRGTVSADGEGLPLEQDIKSIESIRSGFSQTVKFKAVLFGTEGETKDVNIVFQYRVPDSDNIFFKERSYQVQLEQAPVVLSVDHDDRFQNGDEVGVRVQIISNATKILRNLFLSVDYPFGFEFSTSSPAGLDSSSYLIGDLEPGETYTIELKGLIRGQDDEQRTIRYSLGSEDRTRPGSIGTIFTVNESALTVTKPPISLGMYTNEESGPIFVSQPGQRINYVIEYGNNLQTKLLDNVISVSLSGTGYDRRSIDTDQGYYRSADDTISWTQTDIPQLDGLEPSQKGSVSFTINSLASAGMAGLVQNPELVLTTRAVATNFELGGEEKKVEHTLVKRVKVATEPGVNAFLWYNDGPLENSGPIVPIVGDITTYTLVLQASNTTNALRNIEVTATLPRYVSFRDIFVPGDAVVDYDDRNRQITWTIDSIEPGVGYTKPPKEVFLSLAFEPSLDQVDQSPDIVKDIAIRAVDIFAEVSVNNDSRDIDTNLREDSGFGPSQSGNVREASL